MRHPFFGKMTYPWSRADARDLHDSLRIAIPESKRIELLYQSSGPDLPPLTPSQPADLAWKEVLDNLAVAGALRTLCYTVLEDLAVKNSEPLRRAICAVLEAQEGDPTSGSSLGHRLHNLRPQGTQSALRTTGRIGLAVLIGFALLLGGGLVGRWLTPRSAFPSTTPAAAPPLPAVSIYGPYEAVGRSSLSEIEKQFVDANVLQNESTVIIVQVGGWTANEPLTVCIKPAVLTDRARETYGRSSAAIKNGTESTSVPMTWDAATGALVAGAVNGSIGDRLVMLVVVPVTPETDKLLSNPSTANRFLCVQVSR